MHCESQNPILSARFRVMMGYFLLESLPSETYLYQHIIYVLMYVFPLLKNGNAVLFFPYLKRTKMPIRLFYREKEIVTHHPRFLF